MTQDEAEPKLDFARTFQLLTGELPFPWQSRVYDRFLEGKFSSACDIPTGLGKTSVIAVWLIALANSHGSNVPRRLVYVVNRRTVVDQTTDEAEEYRKALNEPNLAALKTKLIALSHADDKLPLAISTLRGQFADNREWSESPARPAIIIGTVDMIGSRLLFSGYGVGFKLKPLHAGFLGQDSIIVHDEAHLEPRFQDLLLAIQVTQKEETGNRPLFRPLHVLELSATPRSPQDPIRINNNDRKQEVVKERIFATKKLHLIPQLDAKVGAQIANFAIDKFKDTSAAVLIFARTVEDVLTITSALDKAKLQNELLIGPMRGYERENLVESEIWKRFLPKAGKGEKPVFLVCTSAGEVGVNITADHLVCDLSTFDSMAQRFGRVNRLGKNGESEIHVIHPTKFDEKDLGPERERTLKLLQRLNGNASPQSLSELPIEERVAAFAPEPKPVFTSDILFDAWSQTTIRGKLPGRPPVAPYLHGEEEPQSAETIVVWREEVDLINFELRKHYPIEELLEDYPLKPHELLRDRTDRVYKNLIALAKRADEATEIWIVDQLGEIKPPTTLKYFVANNDKDALANVTVILPPSIGGLNARGMLDASTTTPAGDVADQWRLFDEAKDENVDGRIRIWDDARIPDRMRLIRTIDLRPDADESELDEKSNDRRFWKWCERVKGGDGEGSLVGKEAVYLEEHTQDVKKCVERFLPGLNLEAEIAESLKLAAQWHDLGKRRERFQRMLRNMKYDEKDPSSALAKGQSGGVRFAEKYRHELGSLANLYKAFDTLLQPHSESTRDLVLHLIAAHHGRGRPHFPSDEIFDFETSEELITQITTEVPRRFARLQRKLGRWGLAYIESILRAADYAASAAPTIRDGSKS